VTIAPSQSASRREALCEADARARAIAQTVFDRPLLLEAGAGTGKTSALVARAVAWCLGPGWDRARTLVEASGSLDAADEGLDRATRERIATQVLEGVVAITFTEAAAAEMEHRLAQAFTDLAQDREPKHSLARALPPLPLRAPRARALLAALDALEVSTIHGFCRRLLSSHPLEAGLHPRFQVDARGMSRAEVVRELLEERLVRSPLGGPAEADLEMLEARGIDAPRLEAALLELLEAAVPAGAFDADPLEPDRVRALGRRLLASLDAFLAAEAGLLEGASNRLGQARAVLETLRASRARLVAEPLESGGELASWLRELSALWPQALLRKLASWSSGRFGRHETTALGDRTHAVQQAARALRCLLEHVLGLDPPLLAAVHRVVRQLLERSEAELRARGAESFGALLRDAHDLLVRHPEVCERERSRIQQLLVDEFQDTDRMQCQIVACLALEGPPGQRPGLFLVGDPKQSIYGWRNADLEAYEELVARLLRCGGEQQRLSVNHRSCEPILAEVERVMVPAMRAEPGIQPPFQPLLAGSDAPLAPEGSSRFAPVEHWVAVDWNRERGGPVATLAGRATQLEARELARDLVQRTGEPGFCWGDVGILLRGTGDLDVYLEALREAGIPFVVDRDRSYARRREVLDARALVCAVLDPNDQLAQVATLRSAWVGVPDAAWTPLWERGFPRALRDALEGSSSALECIHSMVLDVAALLPRAEIPGLSHIAGWEHNLVHAVEVLSVLRGSAREDPPHRFVEKLRTFSLLEATEAARHLGRHRARNLERFFRELQAQLEGRPGDHAALLRTLRRDRDEREPDDPPAAELREDAVQVLTIHKAKGLGFKHVYLLQLHKGRAAQAIGNVEFGQVEGRLELRLFQGSARIASLEFDRVASRREAIERAETLRTLYVAMTRAKQRLVLAGRWCWEGRPNPSESHMRVLESARRPAVSRVLERLRTQHPGDDEAGIDEDGARWAFLALRAEARSVAAEPLARAPLPSVARVASEARRLRSQRADARAHQARPLGATASEKAHATLRELWAAAEPGGPQPRRTPAPTATLLGTAIHRLLEQFDWKAEHPGRELDRRRGDLLRYLEAFVPDGQAAEASRRALALLERLTHGSLWERLRRLQPHVVARELPVLLPPAEAGEGPVGYVSGAIDLLYHDPDSGELVVVDFKTDRIPDDATLKERTGAYAPQGRLYARALHEALALAQPPRIEFWFLAAERVETLAPGG
jgi:ATP-dependent helicase/nuclease subunit A